MYILHKCTSVLTFNPSSFYHVQSLSDSKHGSTWPVALPNLFIWILSTCSFLKIVAWDNLILVPAGMTDSHEGRGADFGYTCELDDLVPIIVIKLNVIISHDGDVRSCCTAKALRSAA